MSQNKHKCKLLPYTKIECMSMLEAKQKTGWGITAFNLPDAWKYSQGEGVKIAVLDTGADLDHPDLKDNLLEGVNFINRSKSPNDDNGHGTHVAGILIAANNDIGMVGVCPKAKVLPVKVLDKNGSGNLIAVAEGIRWAADNNVDFIQMSLGSPSKVQNVRKALQYAASKGIVTFCAAGNAGKTMEVFYPANYPETIAIGAIKENFERADFSCTGQNLDFMAPGADIFSTFPDNWYATLSGTCLAKGSLVYTPNGSKPIESIRQGEMVYAFKDNEIVEKPVLFNVYRGKNDVYEVESCGKRLLATATHKIMTVNTKSKELQWVEVKDLKKHHKMLLPINNNLNKLIYSNEDESIIKQIGLNTNNFILSKWVRREKYSNKDVYDLTVPDADCFVANGFIVHNSMSCPFVTGVAALVLSYNRSNNGNMALRCADDYRELFKKYTTPVTSVDLSNPKFYQGFGIIDPRKFVY